MESQNQEQIINKDMKETRAEILEKAVIEMMSYLVGHYEYQECLRLKNQAVMNQEYEKARDYKDQESGLILAIPSIAKLKSLKGILALNK